MTPLRQTIFVADHPKGWGNCQSAAMASLLDLPLDQVIDTCSEDVRANGFWPPIYAWVRARGLTPFNVDPDDPRLQGRYSIGTGPSPRGPFHHAVVCKNGRMVWDPHPSDDGVLKLVMHELYLTAAESDAFTAVAPAYGLEERVERLRARSAK